MKTKPVIILLILFISYQIISAKDIHKKRSNENAISLQLITNQIQSPVAMAMAPDGSNRIFICQKEGKVWIIKNGKVLPQPFLDVSGKMIKVNPRYDERGLLGIAFHPQYKKNGKFYVYYSAPSNTPGSNCKNILAEFKVDPKNPDRANPASERILMQFEKPQFNHDGGQLAFGPDGYLYISLGDGGGGGDKHGANGNGQNLNTWLAKILRIDVNGTPYKVPEDNPFVGKPDVKPEIWAYGLRNTWRFSFDRGGTHELFAGDVGQNKYEEVDIIRKGGNYGWRIMEGYHIYNMPPGADTTKFIKPITEYNHQTGISVIGGFIYRGSAIPSLKGKYIFGDYNGTMFALTKNNDYTWTRALLTVNGKPGEPLQIYSFGEDDKGELYLLGNISNESGNEGVIYKIVK